MSEEQIIIYTTEDGLTKVDLQLKDGTAWLSQSEIAELFQTTKQNISLHIENILKDGELEQEATVKDYLTVQTEGGRTVSRSIRHYNLDVIISVGYRVKSQRGTQFRIWATRVLREYLLKGYAVNRRIERLEHRMEGVEEKVDFFVRTALPPVEGIFFEGEIFDAYEFVSKLVKDAKKRVILVDNYVDESVLGLLAKRNKAVAATIYTAKTSKSLQADLAKHNAQYPPIAIEEVTGIHDRFLVIDESLYHIGASVKDLGKKLFAFTKMGMKPQILLDKLMS